MPFSITSKQFDVAISCVSVVSYFGGFGSSGTLSKSIWRGLQSFSVVSYVDLLARMVLAKNVEKKELSLSKGAMNAVAEEGVYSGILLTSNYAWIIPRFGAAVATGITAARTLVGKIEKESAGLTLDSKIGLAWAAAREFLLLSFPEHYAMPLLIAADSIVFGLAEVCPSKENPGPPKFSRIWSYKVLSATFFRAVANVVALETGLVSSIAQHVLFNFSRTLK